MTKDPILISDTTALYDFTISQDKAFGNQAMKPLGDGKYGMFAADGNSDGIVNDLDYTLTWSLENGTIGYKNGDYDLNGGINIADRNARWKPNRGNTTRVP